ncbi:hypothetical protein [Microbacterium sp. 1P06AB]|uniref:hypothetical protein n=1 Tax=Microbacterium sp. 1P06AB TaxID=3132289 RepID=UPI0039A69E98
MFLTVALIGCAPTPETDGPLVGPRVEAGMANVCVPASAGAEAFFGEVLSNMGSTAITVGNIQSEESDAQSIRYLLDPAGPALGQVIGASGYPAADPVGDENEIFARAEKADGASIAPGSAATLLIVVSPAKDAESTDISRVKVSYEADGRSFQEEILVDYRVANRGSC